jgi:uncharacterized protein (TIRG00374 family)
MKAAFRTAGDGLMQMNRQLMANVLLCIMGMGFGLFLGRLALQGANWGEIRQALAGWPLWIIAVSVLLVLASSYLRGLRWSLLWTNPKVSALRLTLVENAALGLNNISPIRMFDEGLELGILTLRDQLPGGSVVATMVMCRIQDLAFTLTFIALALMFLPPLWSMAMVLVGTSLFFGGWLVILLNLELIARRFPLLRRIPGLSNFTAGVQALRKRKRRLLLTFSITAAYWLLLGPIGLLMAKGAGIDLPFHLLMVTVLGAIFFCTAIPGLPGAVGTFEFATVSLLELWDVPRSQALGFAIVLHAVLFLPMTAFTVAVLPREGLGSIRALRRILRTKDEGNTSTDAPSATPSV